MPRPLGAGSFTFGSVGFISVKIVVFDITQYEDGGPHNDKDGLAGFYRNRKFDCPFKP